LTDLLAGQLAGDDNRRAVPLIEAVSTGARAAGQGTGVQWSQWVSAILYNGLGRYTDALAEAQRAAGQPPGFRPELARAHLLYG